MLIVVFITCGPLYMQTAASGWGRGGPGQKAGERGLLPSLPCCVSLGAWRASLSAGCCSLEGPGGPDGVVSSHVASTLPAAPLPRSGLAAVGLAWGLSVLPGGSWSGLGAVGRLVRVTPSSGCPWQASLAWAGRPRPLSFISTVYKTRPHFLGPSVGERKGPQRGSCRLIQGPRWLVPLSNGLSDLVEPRVSFVC